MRYGMAAVAMFLLAGAVVMAQDASPSAISANPSASTTGTTPMTAESPGSPADQLRKIEEDWARAMVNKNVGRIGKIEAPEFEFITPDGKVRDREEDLASIRHTSLSDFTNSDVQIRVYGDTAVVSGVGHMKGMENGKDVSGDYRFTDVFVKNNGQWQAVHSESTKIAP